MIKSKKSKEVTNEELARMIAGGFNNVETRLGGVETRLTGVEGEMLKVHERLGAVESKLDRALFKEIDSLETRVKRLEAKAGLG
ncbi:MAG: hypothetical protein Q8P83_03465 [bacterium]|nr:hypothetical protein [bacterium]